MYNKGFSTFEAVCGIICIGLLIVFSFTTIKSCDQLEAEVNKNGLKSIVGKLWNGSNVSAADPLESPANNTQQSKDDIVYSDSNITIRNDSVFFHRWPVDTVSMK